MMFDLARIRQELGGTPPESPYELDLAIAVVADVFREAGIVPPAAATWRALVARGKQPDRRPAQLAALAQILAASSLRAESVAALRLAPPRDVAAGMEDFLEAIWPLTPELILGNAFRQEELVRRWIATWSGVIAGEDPETSRRKLDQLDYRKTLVEVEKAEKARLAEAAKRAEALAKARAEAEEAARGWRE